MNIITSESVTPISLLCGNRAWLDPESSIYGYRCDACSAIVGSIGMPGVCRELYEKEKMWETLSKK